MTEKDYKFYLDEGIKLTNKGQFQDALKSLEKALDLNSDNALIHFSKAVVYHNLNQLRAAYENYSNAIKIDAKMIDAYYNRAQTILAFETKTDAELKEALDDLLKATELDEKFIDAYYYAATIKKKFEDYEGAIELLDKVLEIEPKAPYSRALKKLIEQKYLNK